MNYELLSPCEINFLANAFLHYGNRGGKNFYVRHGSYERILHINEIPEILHTQNLGAVSYNGSKKSNCQKYEFNRIENFTHQTTPTLVLQACINYLHYSTDFCDIVGPSALMIVNKIMRGAIKHLPGYDETMATWH